MGKMRKRGSLELSANAIVILILAITILGLGLGFVRTLFGSLTEKIGLEAENIDFNEPPTADRPITMVKNMDLPRGKKVKLEIGFFHNKNCGISEVEYVPMFKSCVDSAGKWGENYGTELPGVTAAPATLECGQSSEFSSIIAGQPQMPKGDSVCVVEIQDATCGSASGTCLEDPTSVQIFVNVP